MSSTPGTLRNALNQDASNGIVALALSESLRWGNPDVHAAPGGMLIWAVPVMHNAKLIGGLLAEISEDRLFPHGDGQPSIETRAACTHLRQLAEEFNLTNAALLEARRLEAQREKHLAEAIHAYKMAKEYDLRAMYQLDEPLLIAAIRRGDLTQSRAILNRMLVGLMHRGGKRIELMKSFFTELIRASDNRCFPTGSR